MRDFGATFAAELAATRSSLFWSVVVHFDAGDVWIAGRENDAGGVDHAVILDTLGPIGATTGRSEPTQLDVAGTDLTFVNIPKRAGMPGPLSTGERFFDRWERTFETVLADVYCNFETTPGVYVREKVFEAVCSSPSSVGYLLGTLHLASRTERYLNASVLRKIQSSLYPFARPGDVSATVPIVIGAAPKSPGRVVKGSKVSVPLADPSNTSSAVLLPPIASNDVLPDSWTVEFSSAETVQYFPTTDTSHDANIPGNSGSTEPVLAQSFTLAGAQIIRGVTIRHKATGTVSSGIVGSYNVYCTAKIEIWTDSGGNPGSLAASNAYLWCALNAYTPEANRALMFRTPVSLAAGTYWVVVMVSPGGHQPPGAWSALKSTTLKLAGKAAGAFAGGKAKHGTHPRHTYSTPAVFLTQDFSGEMTWDSTLDAEDFYFAIALVTDSFSLTGTATGFDGSGTLGTGFVSTSGTIEIPTDRWQGTPAAGDLFTFKTEPGDSFVIFSESPPATPVGAINAVYFDDQRIASGTTVLHAAQPGADFFRTLGEDANFDPLTDWESEWRAILMPVDVVGTQTFTRIGWQVFHSTPSGVQANPLRYAIYAEGTLPGSTYRTPDRTKRLVSVEVDDAIVPTTGGAGAFIYADIPPTTVTDRRIYVAIETDQFSENDFYEVAMTTEASATGVVLWSHAGAFYVGRTENPGFTLIGGTVTTDTAADDGAGHIVAAVSFDFDIPPNVLVTADIAGITDDSGGTYTGTAGGVLLSPDEVIHWLLNRAGALDADIDLAGTFTDSHAFYSAGAYRFDGVIQEDVTFKTLILKLAYECRSAFDWIVLATLRVLVGDYTDATAVETFTLADILPDSDRVPSIRLERSPDSEIINALTANFNRVLAKTEYKSTVSRHVPLSIAAFGLLERSDLQALDFVRSETMARDVIDLRLSRQAYPVWRIGFSTLLASLAIEKDDPVAIDLTNAAEAGDVLGGWDGSQILQVEAIQVSPELPGLDFALRESNLDVVIADGDGYASPYTVTVLIDQGDASLWDYVMGYPPIGQWRQPSTAGTTPYDGVELNAGWVVYIENGVRKWRNTGGFGSTIAWTGYPPATINASNQLELEVGP